MQDGEEEELQLRMMHAPEINPSVAMFVDTNRRQSTINSTPLPLINRRFSLSFFIDHRERR